LCAQASGEPQKPIVISAAPGHEHKVIIDSELQRAGFQLSSHDFISIKGLVFKNHYSVGIANWGQPQNEVADIPALSEGIVIEGNEFYNTWGPEGDNVSSIAMWGSKDWIVNNNLIDGVDAGGPTIASGIQSYGVINATITNNTIRNVGFGIFWKDHFVKNAATRELWQESDIGYNKISAENAGIRISIRGQNSVEAGHSYIHHNIINGLGPEGVGILAAMSGAAGPSGSLTIDHNLIDGHNNSTIGISVDSHRRLSVRGNIFTRLNLALELVRYSDTNRVKLIYSDYNIFDSFFQNIVDRYSPTSGSITSLSVWKTLVSDSFNTIAISSPDTNSELVTSSLFENLDNYKHSPTSPALKLVQGMNAGPYEQGDEIIGRDRSD
jgi:hypothetical protein